MLIYEELDEKFEVDINKSLNQKYIYIQIESSTTSETYLIDANNPVAKPQLFLKRKKDHLYTVSSHNNGFYILTNKNAENNKIVFSTSIPTSIDACEVIITHENDRLIEDVVVLKNHVITEERYNGLRQIRVYNLQSKESSYIKQEEETYTISLWEIDDFNANSIDYRYNSMTTPTTIINYNLETRHKKETF